MSSQNIVSPSRTYVAICSLPDFDGHYCRKFRLPEIGHVNNASRASHFFLNVIDAGGVACLDAVLAAEDFDHVTVVSPEDPTGAELLAARESRHNKLNLFSDYHKDYHGFRPKTSGWTDDEIVAAFDKVSAEHNEKMKTPEGRQWLRDRCWHAPEPISLAEQIEELALAAAAPVFYTFEEFRAALLSGELTDDDDGSAKYKLVDSKESAEWVNLSNIFNGDTPFDAVGINWYSK